MCLALGLPSPWVAIFGFAWAAAPAAALLGWWLGPRANSGGRRELTVTAMAFGGIAAMAAALVYAVAAMLVSLLPGGPTQPETPLGYVVFPLLVEATLGPVLAVPGSLLAGVWIVALRWLLRRPGSA
jgi:hypothetical protein